MAKRAVPPAGGIWPVMIHKGLTTPSTNGEPHTSLTLTLTGSVAAQEAGRAVVELVAKACDACEGDDVEDVAVLRFFFEEIAVRVPEFHGLMNELVAKGDIRSVERIMRDPGTPGRPRGDLFIVALLEQVMSERNVDAKGAARWLAAPGNLERGEGRRYLPGEKRMRNLHSELKEIFALWRQSLFVRGELLTAWPWIPPGYVPPDLRLVATRLSNSVWLHAPEDSVKEIKKGDHHVEVVESVEQQPVQSDEPEPSELSERSTGKR